MNFEHGAHMESLHPGDYHKAAKPLEKVKLNTLFAKTVMEGHLPGTVLVDDANKPKTFLVKHPYGMSLLIGDSSNTAFNKTLNEYMLDARGERSGHEWLQVYPPDWKPMIESLLGQHLIRKDTPQDQPATTPEVPGKVIEYSRVNYLFNPDLYKRFAGELKQPPYEVVRTTKAMFTDMPGQVIPRYFWRDAEHFMKDSVGYTMVIDGRPASTAFVAFAHGNQLEMGIETAVPYRGKGYAIYACQALIDYCLSNGCEPIWSCRLENTSSFNLARRLGFEPTLYTPYYQLVSH